jgi:hypothetical protein
VVAGSTTALLKRLKILPVKKPSQPTIHSHWRKRNTITEFVFDKRDAIGIYNRLNNTSRTSFGNDLRSCLKKKKKC